MRAIAKAKDALVEALTAAGVDCLSYVPEALPTPCVVLEGSDDYLSTEDTTFDPGEFYLTLAATALVDLVGNEQASDDLDELVEKAARAFAPAGFDLVSMTKPGPFHTTEWLAHGVAFTVRTLINLNTQE